MSIPFKSFNDKVRTMNQAHSKELRLTADEARSLHVAIFEMLDQISTLQSTKVETADQIIEIASDRNFF